MTFKVSSKTIIKKIFKNRNQIGPYIFFHGFMFGWSFQQFLFIVSFQPSVFSYVLQAFGSNSQLTLSLSVCPLPRDINLSTNHFTTRLGDFYVLV